MARQRRKALARTVFWVMLASYAFIAPIYFALMPRLDWLTAALFVVIAMTSTTLLTRAVARGDVVQRSELEQ